MRDGLDAIHAIGVKLDLAENGKVAIIKRELYNHECFLTGDYMEARNGLSSEYGITDEEIKKVYSQEYQTAIENCG